jgi:diguanylate cyclase (GGDEF)-like protein
LERALDNAIALYRDKPHRMALLFIDINHFKSINDKLGHRVGDLALQRVARLLRSRMHFAARLSGDEFVLLLTELEQGAKQVEAVCEQLLHEAAEPCSLAEGIVLPLSLSIGVAVPSAATLTRSEWLRWADEAMYLAKKNGGGFAVHENIGSGLGRT